MTPRRRLTVSLVLTGEVAHEIDGIRRALGATALSRIAPHLTLVPPVNVRDDDLDEAVEIVRRSGQQSRPLRIELGPPDTFHPVTPVLYLAVRGDLDGIRKLRDSLLAGPLASPEARRERGFVPHVTLDQHIDPERIPSALAALSSYRNATVFERVTLLEFHEDVRRWLPLADAALAGPAVIGRGGLEIELSVSSALSPEVDAFQDREWAQYARETYGDDTPNDEPYAITARIGGEIVGVASGQLRGSLCRLGNLVVSAKWRSHGVGAHLVRAVEQLAREHRAESVRLETRVDSRAVGFYEGLGYVATATLPAWRHGQDFLLMEHGV